jgi:hypothetical protein
MSARDELGMDWIDCASRLIVTEEKARDIVCKVAENISMLLWKGVMLHRAVRGTQGGWRKTRRWIEKGRRESRETVASVKCFRCALESEACRLSQPIIEIQH